MPRRIAPARRPVLLALLSAMALALPAAAQPGPLSPFQRIGFDQRVGRQVPADVVLRDETGRTVRLGDYFGKRPVILALVYYKCPMLCTVTLTGLTTSLKGMSFDAGRDFEVVVVSFDPRETPAVAAAARRNALGRYGRPGTEGGWHFLTGDAGPLARLTTTVGFRYFYDEEIHQFAHASGIMVLTPEGRLSRYFYGIDFPPTSVRLGLVEAADHRIGTVVDQVLLYCFHYDPVQGKYSVTALNIVRLSAVFTVVGLGVMVALLRRREQTNRLGTA